MNAREFYEKVKLARSEAKAYMKDKNPEHIKIFRATVAEIDAEIERVEKILKKNEDRTN